MKREAETDELYRLDAAARRWNVAVKTARTWVNQGRVAHVRLGGRIRVPLSEVNRIVAEGYRPAKSA
jgi:excisionase family DNA binding protein